MCIVHEPYMSHNLVRSSPFYTSPFCRLPAEGQPCFAQKGVVGCCLNQWGTGLAKAKYDPPASAHASAHASVHESAHKSWLSLCWKSSGEVWGTSGEVRGPSRSSGRPDSLSATRQICLQISEKESAPKNPRKSLQRKIRTEAPSCIRKAPESANRKSRTPKSIQYTPISEKRLIRLTFWDTLWEQFGLSDQSALIDASLWRKPFLNLCKPSSTQPKTQPSKPLWATKWFKHIAP